MNSFGDGPTSERATRCTDPVRRVVAASISVARAGTCASLLGGRGRRGGLATRSLCHPASAQPGLRLATWRFAQCASRPVRHDAGGTGRMAADRLPASARIAADVFGRATRTRCCGRRAAGYCTICGRRVRLQIRPTEQPSGPHFRRGHAVGRHARHRGGAQICGCPLRMKNTDCGLYQLCSKKDLVVR